jgi:hypothetical protein
MYFDGIRKNGNVYTTQQIKLETLSELSVIFITWNLLPSLFFSTQGFMPSISNKAFLGLRMQFR